ncbi:MAG: kinase/pyrophosphorylase [Anaerolineae bacterium]|nr:kinase/pyrophosphorylase [Anaerolineae bacterium]
MNDRMHETTPPSIYIISGSTGSSGTQMVRTALAQFQDEDVPVHIVGQVRNTELLEEIVHEAAKQHGIIVHTLVDGALRQYLIALAQEQHVHEVDLMGPLLGQLTSCLRQQPLSQPGRYRVLHEQDLRRIDAIRFAVEHDDGKRTYELKEAEIVLAGVSRVGKTPIGVYLATMGWKVANIPLAQGVKPPEELFQIDHRRVFGLTTQSDRLVSYRQHRSHDLGLRAGSAYVDPARLIGELEFAYDLFKRGHFTVIDTTDRSIEENADEIITLINRRFGN